MELLSMVKTFGKGQPGKGKAAHQDNHLQERLSVESSKPQY
jgi:hypothetical protein